jgi:GT2 family glycosyltransferase
MNSVERQNYRHWIVIGVTDDSLKLRIASADCDYMVPLRVGDELSIDALLHFAEAIQENREAAVLYGDEDRLDARGRRTIPWFKPRWNEEMFFAIDYLSSAVAIESSLARRLGANDSLIDIPAVVLAATATAEGPIVHVPHILTHVDARRTADTGRSDAVARLLEPLGATCASGPFGTIKVEWPLPHELPLITIVIPTRDKLELLRPCVESVLGRTNYDNFEILIIDNCSVEKPTAEYLSELQKHPRVRIASYPGTYNFSAINNFAVREAQGSYICLLNNDTQVIEPEWLTEMMRYAVRPKVGAVGAKLLYGDGSIQHAGVVIGIGEAAGHAHRLLPSGEPGYFLMPHVAHFVSAVTAACLLVERKKFDAVGGLDPELAVAFNDVDLCLKIEAAGWRNVYVPHAILIHHESKSRGKDMSPANIDRYRRELKLLQDRWNTKSYEDPLHNPNLDASCETYVLRL